MSTYKRVLFFIVSIFIFTMINNCKKDDTNVTELGGDINVDFAQPNYTASTYVTIDGKSLPSSSIKVVSNDNGIVTYNASVNLKQYPDSLVSLLTTLVPNLISYYNPKDAVFNVGSNGVLNVAFKMKITTEGIQSYFVDGKPWAVKYADGVGTEYKLKRDNGQTLSAKVTEKTGKDEWPYAFYLIKTSKIEFIAPADDPALKKVSFRINHKFGLVYLQIEAKNGKNIELRFI